MFPLPESHGSLSDPACRTALIVEDNPRLLKSMSGQLERAGFRVFAARHYDAALSFLAAGCAHVICINVELPAQSGYELCEYIRGPLGLTRIPIIMTSDRGHSEDMAFAEAAGGNAFLHKPFSRSQLAACVDSLLDRTTSTAPLQHELARLN